MKKCRLVLLLTLLLCVSGCGFGIGGGTAKESEAVSAFGVGAEEESCFSEVVPEIVEPEYVFWPGFFDLEVSEERHMLLFSNSEENSVSLQFTVTDTEGGQLVYESKAVAPGEEEAWDIYSAYQSGVHTVTIRTDAITTTGTGNWMQQEITLTLPEIEGKE